MSDHVHITIEEVKVLKAKLIGRSSLPGQIREAKEIIVDRSTCPECKIIIAREIGYDSDKPIIFFV